MKNVIITGATGMIGSLVLHQCLQNPQISKVTSLLRRPSGIIHDKLAEVIVGDFADYTGLEDNFMNQDIAFFCIGVYTGAVSRVEFRKITVDYTMAFATVLKKQSQEATFCFLSGAGADLSGKSSMMFAKDKGVAENILINMKFGKTFIFRPGYIYPVAPRKEPNFTYRIIRKLYPVLKAIYPNGVITSVQLANAIFTTGLLGGEQTIYENKHIRKIN